MSEGDCPRCGEHAMKTPMEINALSRLTREPDDVPSWICSDCGRDEAFEDIWCKQVTPTKLWPVSFRTFHNRIEHEKVLMLFGT